MTENIWLIIIIELVTISYLDFFIIHLSHLCYRTDQEFIF